MKQFFYAYRFFFIAVVFFGLSMTGLAQNDPINDLIPVPYSSNSDDEFLATAIDPADSSVYAVGYVGSSEAFGPFAQPYQGSRDGILAKYDHQGSLLWFVYVGGPDNDYISDVAVHQNGDISITGQIRGNAFFSSTVDASEVFDNVAGKQQEAFVARYSSSGDLRWVKTYGGTRNDVGVELVTLEDRTYTVIAFDNENNDVLIDGHLVPATAILPERGLGNTSSYALLTHDNTGDLKWKSYFGSNRDDVDLSMFNIMNPYNLIVAGITVQDNRLFVASLYSKAQSLYDSSNNRIVLGAPGSAVDDDIMFMEYDLDGTPLWQTSIWVDGSQDARYVNIASDCNGLYISATLNGAAGIYPNAANRYTTGTGYDPMVFNANLADGEIQWHREMVTADNDPFNDYIGELATDGLGNLFLMGAFHQDMAYNGEFPVASRGVITPGDAVDMFIGVMRSGNGRVRYLSPLGNNGLDYGMGLDVQNGITAMVGTGIGEDEFEFPPSTEANPTYNLALGIASNTMCPNGASCSPTAIINAGSIIADVNGPYCYNQVVQLELTGNTQNAEWATLSGADWLVISNNAASITYTVTGDVKMHAIVSDECGQADTTIMSINLENTLPIAQCIGSHTIVLDSDGNGSLNAVDIDDASSDNCGNVTLGLSQSTFTCADLGSQIVELTVTDEAGNTERCSTPVEVLDTQDPLIICPSDTIVTIPDGSCQMQLFGIGPVSTADNCSPLIISYDISGSTLASDANDASGTYFNEGLSMVTYLIEDGSNNQTTCSLQVTASVNPPTITLLNGTANENETSLDMRIELSHISCEDIFIQYETADLSAVSSSDYNGASNGSFTIPAGDLDATLSIGIIDDAIYEAIEYFQVNLLTANLAPLTNVNAVGEIIDDEPMPELTIADYSVDEVEGGISVQVILNTASSLVTSFDIASLDGTATSSDYEQIATPTSMSIAAGEASIQVDLGIVDDALYEGDETFRLELSNPTNANLGAQYIGEVTIIDDETLLILTPWMDFTSECQVNQMQVGCDISGGCGSYLIARDSSFVAGCGSTGTWTYYHTVTDGCGVTITDSQEATIQDTTPPTLTIEGDTLIDCSASIPAANVSIVDACSSTTWTFTNDTTLLCGSTYEILRTYIAEDACSNTSQASQTITLIDTVPPSIIAADDVIIECGDQKPDPLAAASDNCSSNVIYDVQSSFTRSCGDAGIFERVYTATDACANTATDIQTVTLIDNTPPSLSVASDTTIQCGEAIPPPSSVMLDGCGEAILTVAETSTSGCGNTEVITRVYTATDDCDNTAQETQVITIVDTIAPIITANPDATVECGTTYDLAGASGTDACGSVTIDSDSVFVAACGLTGVWTINYRATDDCGNTAYDSQTITLVDNTVPSITVSDITIECGEEIPAVDATAYDTCGEVTLTNTETFSQGCGLTGTYTRVYTATDDCGNTANATQTITIEDNTPPTITAAADLEIECGEVIPEAEASFSDGCGDDVILTVSETFEQGCGASGEYTRTYTATDECGNTATDTQTVSIIDSTAPTFTINPDALIDCGSDYDVVGSSDWSDCSPVTMQIDTVFSDPGEPYALEINYTLSDDCANDETLTQFIQFQDVTAPVATAQDISLPLNAEGYAVVFADDINNGSTDECSGITLNVDTDTLYTTGDYSVTLTVEDEAGNTSQDQAIVTIYDDIAPNASCQNNTVYLSGGGIATLSPEEVDVNSSDNSGSITLNLSQGQFDCSHVGSIQLDTLFVSDESLTSYCIANITVLDTIAPTIVCQDTLSFSEESTGSDIYLNISIPSYADNCEGAELSNQLNNSSDASGTYPFGYTDVLWTVSNNGQESSCNTIIELIEYIEPAIFCEPIIQAISSTGDCGTLLQLVLPNTAAVNTLAHDQGPIDESIFFPVGETIVTWSTLDEGLEYLLCTTSVTVIDNTTPVITCLSDTIHCGLDLSLPLPSVTDNCETALTYSINGIENAPLTFEHEESTQVIWTASDGSNTASCTTTVIAHDNSIVAQVGTDQDLNAIYETTIDALTQSEGVGYWTFIEGDGVISDNQSNITTVSQLQSGTNVLQWTVESEVCETTSDFITLLVRDFLLPTAFSPNGDGFNDQYRIVGINTIPENEFNVYSRWGELVYSAKNYDNEWAGQSPNGTLLPPDTYYFILDVRGEKDEAYKGSIELRY